MMLNVDKSKVIKIEFKNKNEDYVLNDILLGRMKRRQAFGCYRLPGSQGWETVL